MEKSRSSTRAEAGRPRLSVIIPTFNRAAILAKCLQALSRQTCDGDLYEVIVADDGSSDATRDTVEQLAGQGAPQICYLRQQNAGANTARNRAIEVARGAILLLINDDTVATPPMLAEHLATHDRHPDDRVAVLGRVTISPELPRSRLAPLHLDRAYARLRDRRELDWRAFFTCNVSVKRSLLDRGGRFEERLRYHEDLELGERLSHHGLRVIYCREALGYHDHVLTEEEFFAVAAREGQALAVWSRIAPQLGPVLGSLGFEPALPRGRRIRHRLAEIVVNRATLPAWRWVARHCPSALEGLSLILYDKSYQCVRRSSLRRALREAAS